MQPIDKTLTPYAQTPPWVEKTMPRKAILSDIPAVLLIKIHEEGCWVVASRLASDIMANPNSHLGSFMRTHCALMGLHNVSTN
jgi:hypothetical protein